MAIGTFARRVTDPAGYLRVAGTVNDKELGKVGVIRQQVNGQRSLTLTRWPDVGIPEQATIPTGQGRPPQSRLVPVGREGVSPEMRGAMMTEEVGSAYRGAPREVSRGIDLGGGQFAFATVPEQRTPASGGAAGGMVDRNGDGIPDGAEMTHTVKSRAPDGTETVQVAKYVKGAGGRTMGPLDSGTTRPPMMTAGEHLPLGSTSGRLRDRASAGERSRLEGVAAVDRQDRIDQAALDRQNKLDVARTQTVEPARMEAEWKRYATDAQARGEAFKTYAEWSAKRAELAEAARQFDVKFGQKVEFQEGPGGSTVARYNGQMLEIGKERLPGGPKPLYMMGPDGKQAGFWGWYDEKQGFQPATSPVAGGTGGRALTADEKAARLKTSLGL